MGIGAGDLVQDVEQLGALRGEVGIEDPSPGKGEIVRGNGIAIGPHGGADPKGIGEAIFGDLHRFGRWLAIKVPWSRRFLARLDDWLGYGKRNPVKKWWFDLTVENGRITVPGKTNTRDLQLGKKPPEKHRIAYYTVDMLPPGDCTEVFPFDRKQGLKTTEEMETPQAARSRLKGVPARQD